MSKGGTGAVPREDQLSNKLLTDELAQHRITGVTIGYLFLGVAAFLLHIVLSRLAAMQRAEKNIEELLEDLKQRGFGKAKLITLVIVNRIRADVQLSVTQVQEALGMPVSQVIPPAPEVSFQAATRNLPMIQVQIGGMLSMQYSRLAESIAERITE